MYLCCVSRAFLLTFGIGDVKKYNQQLSQKNKADLGNILGLPTLMCYYRVILLQLYNYQCVQILKPTNI